MKSELTAADMVAVPLKDLWVGPLIPVNLYVQLQSGKFICVAKAKQTGDVEGMAVFRNQRIAMVFVKKTEYRKLVGRKLAEADVILGHPGVPVERKTYFLKTAFNTIIHEIAELGPSVEAINHARYISAHAVEIVQAQPHLSDLLKAIQDSSDWVLNQALGTSLFSVMIAKEMGWQNSQTLEKLSLGGLLQDIGLKELPEDLCSKPRSSLTTEERQLLESHPYRSMKLLQSVGDVPDDVLSIVYEHHENSMGLGFPRRIRDLRMNPLSKVSCLANALCELILISPENPTKRSLEDAIYQIEEIAGQPFNREAFRALKELVKNGRPKLSSIKVA